MKTPEQRASHTAYVARWRKSQKAKKLCRECLQPAAVNPDTGKVMSACNAHLDGDAERAKRRRLARKKAKAA